MGNKREDELAKELADTFGEAADLKRQQANILDKIAVELDKNGPAALEELMDEYEKVEIEIDHLETMRQQLEQNGIR